MVGHNLRHRCVHQRGEGSVGTAAAREPCEPRDSHLANDVEVTVVGDVGSEKPVVLNLAKESEQRDDTLAQVLDTHIFCEVDEREERIEVARVNPVWSCCVVGEQNVEHFVAQRHHRLATGNHAEVRACLVHRDGRPVKVDGLILDEYCPPAHEVHGRDNPQVAGVDG